ncbi:MAG: hypothetical protein JNK82_02245 [Myxococcaceae bacterium]|nr:hypothetical protein [Myxococcaceae bacterium]
MPGHRNMVERPSKSRKSSSPWMLLVYGWSLIAAALLGAQAGEVAAAAVVGAPGLAIVAWAVAGLKLARA